MIREDLKGAAAVMVMELFRGYLATIEVTDLAQLVFLWMVLDSLSDHPGQPTVLWRTIGLCPLCQGI